MIIFFSLLSPLVCPCFINMGRGCQEGWAEEPSSVFGEFTAHMERGSLACQQFSETHTDGQTKTFPTVFIF